MVEVYLISQGLGADEIVVPIEVVLPRRSRLCSCEEQLDEEVIAQPLIQRRITLTCLDFQYEFFICLVFV